MFKRSLLALLTVLAVTLVAGFWRRDRVVVEASAKSVAVVGSLAPKNAPVVPHVTHDRAPEAPAVGTKTLEQASSVQPLSQADWENFAYYRQGVGAFDPREAERIGLSANDQRAILLIAWGARRKLNVLEAERATVGRTEDGRTVLTFKLDEATSQAIRSETRNAIRDAVGEKLWPAVEASIDMRYVEGNLDGFGAVESTFTFTPNVVSNVQMLSVEVRREDWPGTVRSCNHILGTFRAIYGPLAAKAGF